MTERLKKLCAFLSPCGTFVDVGCDHGYCTLHMFKRGLCGKALITDISAKSLSKAEKLLAPYVERGDCRAVCCDGLAGVDEGDCDLALIAGMGGEEILKILKQAYIPRAFVFQPMKNAPQLRGFLLESGCRIEYDGLFTETRGNIKKYYFVIKGTRGGGTPAYTPQQLYCGRDSLGTPQLKELLAYELQKNMQYAGGSLSPASRAEVEGRIDFIKGILGSETH